MKHKKYTEPHDWPEFHETLGLVAAWRLRSWRLTERAIGQIPGVKGNLTIVATDGNLGAFLDDAGAPYLGHIERSEDGRVLQAGFDGKVETLGTKARRDAVKAKREAKKFEQAKRVKSKRARILDSLNEI